MWLGTKKNPYLVRRLLQGNCLVASFLLKFLLIWLQAYKQVNFISLADSFFALL